MHHRVLLAATAIALAIVLVQSQNLRPIIGIMTEPLDPEMKIWGGKSFITASYVKYIESAGARVVLFRAFASDRYSVLILVQVRCTAIRPKRCSTTLVPGGDVDIETSPFYSAVKFFVNGIDVRTRSRSFRYPHQSRSSPAAMIHERTR